MITRLNVGDTVVVEGCPCVVLQADIEAGIVQDNDRTDLWGAVHQGILRPLVIAPDGSFVLPNPFSTHRVDHTQPDEIGTIQRLRRLARGSESV